MRTLFFSALLLTGCGSDPTQRNWEFVPEMVDSVPYDSYAENPVTRDGKTLQAPPPGTIARGVTPFHFGPGNAEAERAGRDLTNPLPKDAANLARGDKVFHSICTPCHGSGGQGDGPIIPRFPSPPSLTATHARQLPDGRIFHIISRGQGLMPSHAAQVAPLDRWRVVQFIRSLQGGAK